ncbi:Spondin-1 [Liparis tanakae]|uniref:Spondin-1 n=1 Tax=Liparis tanakae TaxID=230148 RepID=A0A4Z2I7Q6_9TELE|nr:Spondin-1 [Liparis tanakae]
MEERGTTSSPTSSPSEGHYALPAKPLGIKWQKDNILERFLRLTVHNIVGPESTCQKQELASIVQKRIIYFQDEGSLTIRLCEKERVFGEATEAPAMECCACGTAKYRLTFYGNWSEKVHPKDYPRRANHWSALIGASHSRGYVLWEYGGYASEGVRQVAEFGSPIKMEEQIRQKLRVTALTTLWMQTPLDAGNHDVAAAKFERGRDPEALLLVHRSCQNEVRNPSHE